MVPGLEAIEGSTSAGTQMKVDGKNVYVGLTGGSKRYFEMTGAIDLIQGRLFTPAEEDAGARVAVLSRSGLKVLYGSPDVEAVGKSLELNGKSYQIIGVTEDGMYGGGSDDYVNVFMPAQTVTDDFNGGHERAGLRLCLERGFGFHHHIAMVNGRGMMVVLPVGTGRLNR